MVKKRRGVDNAPGAEDWRSDPRFDHVTTDPRYRSSATRKATQVEIDDRFGAMFTDPEFATSVRSDKRGRPVAMSSRQDLKRFYGLRQDGGSSSKKESEEEEDEEEAEEDEEEDAEPDDESIGEESESKSNEISSDDEEFRELERSAGAAAELNNDDDANSDTIEPTSRLAVTQQDWEQLKATDLYMLLSSHCPASTGRLISVTVYPSRFGQRRMAEEAAAGPLELRRQAAAKKTDATASSSDTYRHSLRRHQLKRLWYFYAVAEFDSTAAAARVFEQCAGLEVESTGGCLRLSYVPDGMEFGGPADVPDEWRHLVTRCSGLDPAAYKPRKLTAGSLNRTRVGLTWDETPVERTRYLRGLFDKGDFDEADPDLKRLSEFLALSSDEEDEEDADKGSEGAKARTARLRQALLGGDVDEHGRNDNDEDEIAAFSDDELPDDVAFAVTDADADDKAKATATKVQQQSALESRKRSRRRRLKEQAKRAKLAKAGLLPTSKDSDESDEGENGEGRGETPAGEQELAMLVADRTSSGAHSRPSAVTAADVASDSRFGALFTDPSYHVDPTHSEARKVIEVQRLIVGAKRRRAVMDDA